MYSIKWTVKALASAAAVAMLAGVASAQVLSPGTDSFEQVGEAGPWIIYADVQRQSCLAEGQDSNGNVVQMGLTADHSLGYVGVFTPVDLGITAGEQDITITVNGNAYSGKAMMREHGLSEGYQGGYFVANNPDFVADMEAGQTMLAFSDTNGEGVAIDLTGSHAAIEAARACTAQLAAN
ncbi:hypothetical protein [Paracoccus sp. (in: a-proteobacteria)]|uniref:hypothetical protein n=1 Tax=Paracoccus sp. TaxID=267 RepID=UPI003A85C68D